MRKDDPTSRFYAVNAATYADYARLPNVARLAHFLAALPPQADILELGCGNGRDSAFMIERGFRVTPTDGVAEMAAEAQARIGIPVRVLRFGDIAMIDAFDGIWANACLLHVPRPGLAGVLATIHRALRPGGVFYASYKAGGTEHDDDLGRYYNNPSRDELETVYSAMPWAAVEISHHSGGGYDGKPTEWLHVTASKR